MILKKKIYFIIGTGTDVGKTFSLEKICSKLQESNISFNAIKPVISGFDYDDLLNDSAKILKILGRDLTKDNFNDISPWRFKEPISPNLAAQKENKKIDFLDVVGFCREKIHKAEILDQFLFIEAAGGVMTPITNDKTFLDLIVEVKASIILLTSNYLGTISHSLCAVESLKSKGVLPEIILVNNYPDVTDILQITDTINHLSKIRTMPFDIFLQKLHI